MNSRLVFLVAACVIGDGTLVLVESAESSKPAIPSTPSTHPKVTTEILKDLAERYSLIGAMITEYRNEQLRKRRSTALQRRADASDLVNLRAKRQQATEDALRIRERKSNYWSRYQNCNMNLKRTKRTKILQLQCKDCKHKTIDLMRC